MTEVAPKPPEQPPLGRLAQLHRMSRTAGAGSTDYAAVNTTAVVAAVLGAASFLALLTPIFLFVPVIALVMSIVALRQVKASNGTQTGMVLAIIGLILGLGFAGVTGLRFASQQQQRAADRRDLGTLISDFGAKLSQNDTGGAYALFDDRLKEQLTLPQLEKFVNEALNPNLGRVKSIESNGLFAFEEDPDTGNMIARGMALAKTEKLPDDRPLRPEVTYRRSGGKWLILNIPDWVAAAKGPSGRPAGAELAQ